MINARDAKIQTLQAIQNDEQMLKAEIEQVANKYVETIEFSIKNAIQERHFDCTVTADNSLDNKVKYLPRVKEILQENGYKVTFGYSDTKIYINIVWNF